MGSYFEIKYPIIQLIKGESESIWFEDDDYNIVCFDDIPVNYPRWAFCIHSYEEMVDMVIRMICEYGWELNFIDEDYKECFYEDILKAITEYKEGVKK